MEPIGDRWLLRVMISKGAPQILGAKDRLDTEMAAKLRCIRTNFQKESADTWEAKPLPDPILTQIYDAIMASPGHNELN